jgi:signal transduction histidine kinase/ligand-binding sensor domain-containing protein
MRVRRCAYNRVSVLWMVVVALWVCALPTAAQQAQTARFDHLTTEDGLSHGGILSIMQSRAGFIWIATQDGLNCYDGYTFKTYKNRINDTTTLYQSFITDVLEDRQGRLWATSDVAVHLYQPQTDNFRRFLARFAFPTVPKDFRITKIFQDSRGRLWVCTSHNILLFRPERQGEQQEWLSFALHPKETLFVNDIAEDADGALWLATGKGLMLFHPDEHGSNGSDGQIFATRCSQYLPAGAQEYIQCLLLDKSGLLWVGTYNGVFALNTRSRSVERYYGYTASKTTTAMKVEKNFIVPQTVMSLLQRRNGDIWCGTRGQGVLHISHQTSTLTKYANNAFDAKSLLGNYVAALCEDAAGVVWVGDGSYGLSKYVPSQQRFLLYRHNAQNPNSLSDNFIRGIHEDDDGRLWIATQYGGLNMLDRRRKSESRTLWKHYPFQSNTVPTSINPDTWAVAQDPKGVVWVSSLTGAVMLVNPRTQAIQPLRVDGLNDSLVQNARALYRDHHNTLWIALPYQVLNVSSLGKVIARYPLYGQSAETFCQDSAGDMWAGNAVGLWRLRRDRALSASTVLYHVPESITLPIERAYVTMLMQDQAGCLWVATKGEGIFYTTTPTAAAPVWNHLNQRTGLPHNNVYAVLQDQNGLFWISSDAGISRLHLPSKTFRTFNTADGLQGLEYNRMAYCKLRTGEMAFGGINGLNIFSPEQVNDSSVPPPVVLTSLKVNNQERWTASQLLDAPSITLTHQENFLSFEFAALDFANVRQNVFAYQLVGVENAFVQSGDRHQVTYTNLAPGTYRFCVKAANADGRWSEAGRTLRILITPPWWQTWWARSLYLMLAVAAFALAADGLQRRKIQLLRVRQKEREEEILRYSNAQLAAANDEILRQKDLVEQQNHHLHTLNIEKNELLNIVAHDLKSPLNGIRSLAALMEEHHDALPKGSVEQNARLIRDSANRMFQIVRRLVELDALEQGVLQPSWACVDCAELLAPIVLEYRHRAQEKSIALHYQPLEGLLLRTDAGMLVQILENLLSNAIKYSPVDSSVWLKVELLEHLLAPNASTPSTVRFVVRDEGQGLKESDKEKLFGKFARLSAQPTGGEHSTGLGLNIVKKLVETLQGRVWCESEFGKGATFIVELPVTP